MDGQTYRVVWTGVLGEVIAPIPNGTIPGLHFFLTSSATPVGIEAESSPYETGLADGTASVHTGTKVAVTPIEVESKRDVKSVLEADQLAHNQTVKERLTKALATAVPALQELLTCLTTLAAEQNRPQKAIAEESVSSSESVPSLQSIAAPESTPQNETPVDEKRGPPQATPEYVPADPPPQAEVAGPWDAHPMSEEERQWVIGLALDEEKMTVLCRELFLRSHVGEHRDPPIDTTYVPKADDVKELALLEGKPVVWAAVIDLYEELSRAPLANLTGEYQQPRHIPSLRDFEKQRVRIAFRSTEQRAHFEYLMRRRVAIRLGREIPPPPKSTSAFNREARRDLEKFFRDSRTSALMTRLLQKDWEAAASE